MPDAGLVPIRAVAFDAVGTLIFPEPAVAEVYAAAGRRQGSRLTSPDIQQRLRVAFARQEAVDAAAGWVTSEEREAQRWRAIVAEVLDDVGDPAACFAELYEHFARPAAWRCEPAAATLLPELRQRGYRLALASNFDARLYGVCAGLPELCELEPIVVSAAVGWRKPGRAFFDALVRALGVPAGATLYVGDDLDNDYRGATAAGLQALHLGLCDDAAVPCIARLDDLLGALP